MNQIAVVDLWRLRMIAGVIVLIQIVFDERAEIFGGIGRAFVDGVEHGFGNPETKLDESRH